MGSLESNRGIWYMPLGLTCTALAFVAVMIRFYTRAFLTRSFGSDDYAMILPLISTLAGQVVDTMSVLEGFGKHARDLSPKNIEVIVMHTYTAWIRVFISYFFLRASIMLFTLRLLPYTKVVARRIIYVAFFLNFAITLIACVCFGISCTPFRAQWANVPGAKCKPKTLLIASQTMNGVLACVIDITTALIPAFLLWDLQMRRRTKVVLDAIFLLGLLTAGLSVGRAVTTRSDTYDNDLTWNAVIPGTMSCIEDKLGIFFASCPMIRQFITYTLRKKTMLPTTTRPPPDGDFIAMRKRVKLRDIFWYRKNTSNDVAPPPSAKPNQPKHISPRDPEVSVSASGRIWNAIARMFGRRSQPLRHGGGRVYPECDSEGTLVQSRTASGHESGVGGLAESGKSLKSKGPETFLMSATNATGTGRSFDPTTSVETDPWVKMI